jgi:prolipoprotein diacylglyceryltransferase
VFFINIRLRREKLIKYIDSIVLSFLLALSVWYIWALLWGQIYGKATNIWIEIIYDNPFSPISSTPVFPLPLVYFLLFFIEFAVLYILSLYIKVKWFIGYIWFIVFSLIILIFENFSWKHDIFNNYIFLNMNQILAIFLMIFSFYRLYILSQISAKDTSFIIEYK